MYHNPRDTLLDVLKQGYDDFIAAAANGDFRGVLPYLSRYEAYMTEPGFGDKRRCSYDGLQTALHEAAREDHAEMVDMFLTRGFHLDQSTMHAASAAFRRKSSVDTFEILLKHGHDVNYAYSHSGDALTWAAFLGNTSLVRWLLSKGSEPDLNLRYQEFTALECAAMRGHVESTRLLVDAGAQVKTRSALPLAAAEGYLEVVKYLLDVGADIDEIPDNEEIYYFDEYNNAKNALCAAAENGRAEVVRFLLERGADKGITDKHGKTPLQLAEIKCYEDCIELLK